MIYTAFLSLLLTSFMALPSRAAEPLGRLFLTPEQRAALDQHRQHDPDTLPVETGAVTLNGVVRRSSGRNTIWLNGRPVDATRPTPQVSAQPSGSGDSVVLRTRDHPPRSLRVGEAMDPATGRTDSPIGSGRITLGRSKKPTP